MDAINSNTLVVTKLMIPCFLGWKISPMYRPTRETPGHEPHFILSIVLHLYINLRRSRDGAFVRSFVAPYVRSCVRVCHSVRFDQLLS